METMKKPYLQKAVTLRRCLRSPCHDDEAEKLSQTWLSISPLVPLPAITHSIQASEQISTVKPTRKLEHFSILPEIRDG